jgi:hypothetical protein
VVTLHNFIPEGEGGAACFAFRPEDRISWPRIFERLGKVLDSCLFWLVQ